MFSFKPYREPEHCLADYLPWAALVAPGVVMHKERLLQKTVAFRGPDLASSSEEELMAAVSRLNNALKRLGSGWALFVEAQRFPCTDYPRARWPHPVAEVIDGERQQAFEAKASHFESNYFLTFAWQMPAQSTQKLQALFFSEPEAHPSQTNNERDLEYFQKQVRELVDILEGVFVEVAALDDSQTLSYLHSTVSTERHPVRAPETPIYLDALLPDQPFTPGDIPMLGEVYIPTLTFVGFPSTSYPGMLDELNHLQIPYRWITRFISLDREDARQELEKNRKRWWQKRKNLWTLIKEEASHEESALLDSDASNKSLDADVALQELGEDLVAFGYLTTTVTVWHEE
jgi:type IV secretion system protein VirB4